MNGNKSGKGSSIIAVIVIVLFLVMGFASCSDDSSKSDIARDPDGFLGYSDSFWDWYVENN